MDKRTVTALVFIGIVFLLWPIYMRKVVGVRQSQSNESSRPLISESDTTGSPFDAALRPAAEQPIREKSDIESRRKDPLEVETQKVELKPEPAPPIRYKRPKKK